MNISDSDSEKGKFIFSYYHHNNSIQLGQAPFWVSKFLKEAKRS